MSQKTVNLNSPQFWAMVRSILASGDSVEIKSGPKNTIKVIRIHRGTVIMNAVNREVCS